MESNCHRIIAAPTRAAARTARCGPCAEEANGLRGIDRLQERAVVLVPPGLLINPTVSLLAAPSSVANLRASAAWRSWNTVPNL